MVSVAAEELDHIRCHSRGAGKRSDAGRGKSEPQRALMLIDILRLKGSFGFCTDNYSCDLPSAVGEVGDTSFVEGNDQQAAALESRTGD